MDPSDLEPQPRDAGLTLIEVLVALLVFAVIASGIVAGLATVTRMTADDRARVTAQNLAAREIDRVRALGDPFKVMSATTDADRTGVVYTVDGRTYTVKRSVSWVSQQGLDVSCAQGSALFSLRINVRVTWPGRLANTAPVQDDTMLAPTTGLSDTTSGGIAVSVADDQGNAQGGVGVAIKANSGGTTPAKQPANTDSSGCSYLGNLQQGNYDVTLSKNGWIDGDQNATPTRTVQVVKGRTTTPQFPPYAQAANYRTIFQLGPDGYGGALTLASNMETTFISGDSISSDGPSAQYKTIARYPYSTGYAFIPGLVQSADKTATCAASDPQSWPAGSVGTTKLAQGVRATRYTAAGTTEYAYIPIGGVKVKVPGGTYIGAIRATPPTGTPSCGISSTYTWSTPSDGGWTSIALPYGSWKLYYGTSVQNATLLSASQIQILTNVGSWPVGGDGVVVLDPRRRQ